MSTAAIEGVADVEVSMSRERLFWVMAICFFGAADLATTTIGISLGQVAEAGPVQSPLLEQFGILSVPGLKAAVFAVFYGLWRLIPDPHSFGVPLALTVTGVAVTLWNSTVLFVAAT